MFIICTSIFHIRWNTISMACVVVKIAVWVWIVRRGSLIVKWIDMMRLMNESNDEKYWKYCCDLESDNDIGECWKRNEKDMRYGCECWNTGLWWMSCYNITSCACCCVIMWPGCVFLKWVITLRIINNQGKAALGWYPREWWTGKVEIRLAWLWYISRVIRLWGTSRGIWGKGDRTFGGCPSW